MHLKSVQDELHIDVLLTWKSSDMVSFGAHIGRREAAHIEMH